MISNICVILKMPFAADFAADFRYRLLSLRRSASTSAPRITSSSPTSSSRQTNSTTSTSVLPRRMIPSNVTSSTARTALTEMSRGRTENGKDFTLPLEYQGWCWILIYVGIGPKLFTRTRFMVLRMWWLIRRVTKCNKIGYGMLSRQF